jgi:uncharacterized phage protein (TIGR01671 family)
MENRYLFKAKRIDNGEWVQGNYVNGLDVFTNCEEIHIIFEPNTMFYSSGETDGWYKVDPTTICQCTGLKDKNGNLIWENDIVAYWDTYSTENGLAEADCIGQVVWDDETLSFQVTNRLSAESYEVLDECSVIGNIFDNPELLESEG